MIWKVLQLLNRVYDFAMYFRRWNHKYHKVETKILLFRYIRPWLQNQILCWTEQQYSQTRRFKGPWPMLCPSYFKGRYFEIYFAKFAFENCGEFGQGMNFCCWSEFSKISFKYSLWQPVWNYNWFILHSKICQLYSGKNQYMPHFLLFYLKYSTEI